MAVAAATRPAGEAPPHRRSRLAESLIGSWFAICGGIVGVLIAIILVFLLIYAWPAMRFNGWSFFTTTTWNIGNLYGGSAVARNGVVGSPGAAFGIVVFVVGTLASTGLALLIATPLATLVAVALVYRIPSRLAPASSALIELMAGVPSVVYGLWGVIAVVPFLGSVPGAGAGYGLFAAGLILSLMILPIMSATIRDVLLQVPADLIEASVGLGSTHWEAVSRVALPAVKGAILASFVLAAGRALGETMAVLMVCGSAINTLPHGVFSPINTIAAVIVSQLDSALTDPTGLAERTLGELALVLFAMTLVVNVGARAAMRGLDRAGQAQRS